MITTIATSGTVDCSSRGRLPTSVKVLDGGTKLEIIYRTPSNITYACYPARPAPDTIEKEIWEVKNGKLVFQKSVYGTHTPAHNVPESITFPE